MRKFGWLLVVALTALSVVANAQVQRLGSFPRYFLLLNPKVQTELKLRDSQKAAIKKAVGDIASTDDQGRVRMQIGPDTDMDGIKSALKKIVNSAQHQRLTEIWIQRDGAMALGDADFAKELGLSAEQNKKVDSILEGFNEDMRDLAMSSGGQISADESKAIRDKARKKMEAVLSASQKTKFETMKGKPYQFN